MANEDEQAGRPKGARHYSDGKIMLLIAGMMVWFFGWHYFYVEWPAPWRSVAMALALGGVAMFWGFVLARPAWLERWLRIDQTEE